MLIPVDNITLVAMGKSEHFCKLGVFLLSAAVGSFIIGQSEALVMGGVSGIGPLYTSVPAVHSIPSKQPAYRLGHHQCSLESCS